MMDFLNQRNMRHYYERLYEPRSEQYSCPHGNGIWYEAYPTFTWYKDDVPYYRTKSQWPYSYDSFYVIGSPSVIKGKNIHSADTDRMAQWDHDKWNKACDAVTKKFGHWHWHHAKIEHIDVFVKSYYGKDAKAVALVEWCNQATGYPGWSVFYKKNYEKKAKAK